MRRTAMWAIIVVLAAACGGVSERRSYEVVYELTGTGTVDLTATGQDDSSANAVPLPWTHRYVHEGTRLPGRKIVAQGRGDARGLTCRITVDGEKVTEHNAPGGWAIVACVTRPID